MMIPQMKIRMNSAVGIFNKMRVVNEIKSEVWKLFIEKGKILVTGELTVFKSTQLTKLVGLSNKEKKYREPTLTFEI